MGLHWDSALMPYDWQNDREYADPVPDVLGAADDARKAERERRLAEPDQGAGHSAHPGETASAPGSASALMLLDEPPLEQTWEDMREELGIPRKADKELAEPDSGSGASGGGAASPSDSRPDARANPGNPSGSASPPSLEWAANLARLTYGPKDGAA